MFEVGKEYLTINGRRARIYATDGGGEFPIHGAIRNIDSLPGRWHTTEWTAEGRHCARYPEWGLVPPTPEPRRIELWATTGPLYFEIGPDNILRVVPK